MMLRIAIPVLLALLVPEAPRAGGNGGDHPGGGEAAARDCVLRTVEAVQKRYESIRDLAADFEQTTRSVALGSMAASETPTRGKVVFAKPGKMRWEYAEPPSLVVTDGAILVIYDPARGEAQRLRVGAGYLSGAAIQFLLGEGDILGSFDVTALRCEDDLVELELLPKEPATYEKLAIRVDPESATVIGTSMFDLLGNQTHVSFADIETNRDPGREVFEFDPPEGVTVLELDPMPSPDAQQGDG